MNKFILILICFFMFGCKTLKILPESGSDKTDAKIWKASVTKPKRIDGEPVYLLTCVCCGKEEASTKDKAEWESWLQDVSKAPFLKLQEDRNFVLEWCAQFAELEPEDIGLTLMNYFKYDYTFTHIQPTWSYGKYSKGGVFFDWHKLRRAITDKTLVCAGYAQLFYLVVKKNYPDIKYITSNKLRHARNYFEDEHWDITWLDDAGIDYEPKKIKFDFTGMQKRISSGINGKTGSDWQAHKIVVGEGE